VENRVGKYARTYLSIKISYENDMNYGKLLKMIENHISIKLCNFYQKKPGDPFHMKNLLRKRVNSIFIKIVNCVHT